MIPLAIPNLEGNEGLYLQACVEENFVSTVGRFVTELEDRLAKRTGSDHAVCVSQGTTGLHAALTSVGVNTGDLVIIPTLTFIASANAVSHCKAVPWLMDITENSWTLDPDLLENALNTQCHKDADGQCIHTESGRRVAAIMPVHTMGHPPDMDRITSVAKMWNLPVVADAAAALGTRYKNKEVGQMGATLNVMSFNGNKIITTGGGGVILGQDDALMKYVRHLTTTARVGSGYDHDIIGFNYRMTNVQAAIGVGQMEILEQFLTAKKRIADRYTQAWKKIDGAEGFRSESWGESNHWFSGIFLPAHSAETVSALREHLRESGVDARPFWKPMHWQTPYLDAPKTLTGIADQVWEQILPLPCSTQLTDHEQQTVIDATLSFFDEA